MLAKASPITEKIATANNKNMVVKTDISNIPCDEKNRSSGVTIIAVKNPSIVLFGLTSVSYTHLTLPTILRV